jgi:hypothetical protein
VAACFRGSPELVSSHLPSFARRSAVRSAIPATPSAARTVKLTHSNGWISPLSLARSYGSRPADVRGLSDTTPPAVCRIREQEGIPRDHQTTGSPQYESAEMISPNARVARARHGVGLMDDLRKWKMHSVKGRGRCLGACRGGPPRSSPRKPLGVISGSYWKGSGDGS